MFWNIEGINRFYNTIDKATYKLLQTTDIVFLSETWLLSSYSKISGKDFFASDAIPTLGRPSGGLQMHINPQLSPKIISRTEFHICVSIAIPSQSSSVPHPVIKEIGVIGVYYKPSLDFDDLISDLLGVLDKCSLKNFPVLLAGDFNIKIPSPQATELSNLLDSFGISLVSDPNHPSFISQQGGISTPDHAFISDLVSCNASTLDTAGSSHLPIHIKMNKFNASHTSDSSIPVLDYKNCNQTLSSQLPLSDNDSLLLASQLNKIILDNISLKPKRNPPSATNSSKIDLLKREVNVALSRLIYFPNEANKQYLIASRKSLSKEISINSKKFKETQLAEAITNARENGISSLFKAAKKHPKASSCAVPLHQ